MATSAIHRADETPLARILREEGRKQTWLAGRIGVSKTTLNAYVRGLHVPNDKRVLIADALSRTVEELWPNGTPTVAA